MILEILGVEISETIFFMQLYPSYDLFSNLRYRDNLFSLPEIVFQISLFLLLSEST